VTSGLRIFGTAVQADQMVDLLNNQEGRNIGSTTTLSAKDLALKTLDFYKDQGLWTASKTDDGAWLVQKSSISNQKYEVMKATIQQKDEYGRWLK
jgi:hypothetical protein